MNKKLSRLVALGLLATTLWQPVAILAESNALAQLVKLQAQQRLAHKLSATIRLAT